MLPHLHAIVRKIGSRLISNRKGFSSIVGAVFAVLVMVSLVSTVFVWSLSQNTIYNNTVRETNLADLDRINEKIVADVTSYGDGLGAAGSVLVNGTLENDGPLSVHIVTLWVVDANNSEYAHKTVDLTLAPGNVTTLSGPTAVNVPLPNLANDSLSCWFVSERGNVLSKYGTIGGTTITNTILYNPVINNSTLENPTVINNGTTIDNSTTIINNGTGVGNNSVLQSLIASGIGAFAFDFTSFRYYNITAGKFSMPGEYTCIVPLSVGWRQGLGFSFNITNLYPTGQDIILSTQSVMWSYFPAVPGHTLGPNWYLVNMINKTTGEFNATYSPIILPWNVTVELFWAKQDARTSDPGLGAVNLLMFGEFVGAAPMERQYAQNIPFISIYITA